MEQNPKRNQVTRGGGNSIMERFLKRGRVSSTPVGAGDPQPSPPPPLPPPPPPPPQLMDNQDAHEIVADPGLRPIVHSIAIDSKQLEDIRRAYLLKGPCQPILANYPTHDISGRDRHFCKEWFIEYGSWLEYSESKDACFCLYCYLFKSPNQQKGGGDHFVGTGFRNWKKKEALRKHVGDHNSVHMQCFNASQDLMNRKQHIDINICKASQQEKNDYSLRLRTTVRAVMFLLRQGSSFRGHDESEKSMNKGWFLELLQYTASCREDINRVVLANAPDNNKLTSPMIQKDVISACAYLTTKAIIADMNDDLFALLVDESRDVSTKEQMALVVRYVDKKGSIIERFITVVHVKDTKAVTLKATIESAFAMHGLSMSNVRGQGYDGGSNMQGEFNGLKALILAENESAYYVHCFAHQLQLILVAVAKKHDSLNEFFEHIARIVNVVQGSCKRQDMLREKQLEKVIDGVCKGETKTGRGLNQEANLKRPGDTRWGSHYGTIMSLLVLFSSVIDVVEFISMEGDGDTQRYEAKCILRWLFNFEFVFLCHLMKSILGITNDLSQALQRRDQDLANAMNLVKVVKQRLQKMREDGWNELLQTTCDFCNLHEIAIPNMKDNFVVGRPKRGVQMPTNLHHYQVELFNTSIDFYLQELNNRFDNRNMELLSCVACLEPSNSFASFDKAKLIRLAEFYPKDFSEVDRMELSDQLENYISYVASHDDFCEIEGIGKLAKKLVESKMDTLYPLVYKLVKLALILPVATASVERAFSAMKIIKNDLRNRMGDEYMNDCLVPYIEKDVFCNIDEEEVMKRFQEMKPRRILL